jgi:hypothetical protein
MAYGHTKKTASKVTFVVIARLDRAIQEALKKLDSSLRGNDGIWGLAYGPLNMSRICFTVMVNPLTLVK